MSLRSEAEAGAEKRYLIDGLSDVDMAVES